MLSNASLGAQVKFRVVDKHGKSEPFLFGGLPVTEVPYRRNLMTLRGAAATLFYHAPHAFARCLLGTDGRPNSYQLSVLAQQSGTSVALSAEAPEIEVGDHIKWSDGQWAEITEVDGTTLTAADSKEVNYQLITVYKTSMKSLYASLPGVGYGVYLDSGDVYHVSGTVVHTITCVFDPVDEQTTYRELAFGTSGVSDISSRIAIPEGIQLNEGQALSIICKVTVRASPTQRQIPLVVDGLDLGVVTQGIRYIKPALYYFSNGKLYYEGSPNHLGLLTWTQPPATELEGPYVSFEDVVFPTAGPFEPYVSRSMTYTATMSSSPYPFNGFAQNGQSFYVHWTNPISIPSGFNLSFAYTTKINIDLS